MTHLNYLKLDNITEVFSDEKLVDHFIFSQRLTFLNKKAKIYNKSNIYEKLFGIGYINNNKTTKLIEMDYFDIFYSHGLFGFLIFTIIILYTLYKVLDKEKKLSYEKLMLHLSLILIIILSFFTGHIITAPSVSLLCVILILSLSKRKKKDLLFASKDLNIGGIETSQVNILNNIDYNKYNVTLVLEEVKGNLLSNVNKNVVIRELKVNSNNNVLIRKSINLIRQLIFKIFNYQNYDFSCCYTTYSYSCNKIAKVSSTNNSIYIHSDYKYVYNSKNDYLEFFNSRKVNEYKNIIFVSNESKKSFLEYYPELENKTKVLNNFINIEDILTKSNESIKEKKSSNKTLFVFIGRLDDSSKKLKRAINLVKEIPSIELWIVGDGPDRKMYEDYSKKLKVENNIKFLGKKNNPYPYMKEADYIILTSDYEGFPVIYLEAITLNKRIITTISTSDESINIKDYAYIISKEEKEMVQEVKEILKKSNKVKKIDLNKIQKERIKKLNKLFNSN
jgi:glycosyltransferase involved in cell wall biosynthesis